MLLNISDVLTSEGRKTHFSVPLEMTSFTSRLGRFLITEKSPVELTFTNDGVDRAKVEGRVELGFRTKCDRCLKEVPTSLLLTFDRTVTSRDVESSEDSDDDLIVMEGCQFNVETFVYDEILVNWPMKILCHPQCKGVCPVCGKDLNEGECGCDTFVPDPRMAAIQDIFNANKEV